MQMESVVDGRLKIQLNDQRCANQVAGHLPQTKPQWIPERSYHAEEIHEIQNRQS